MTILLKICVKSPPSIRSENCRPLPVQTVPSTYLLYTKVPKISPRYSEEQNNTKNGQSGLQIKIYCSYITRVEKIAQSNSYLPSIKKIRSAKWFLQKNVFRKYRTTTPGDWTGDYFCCLSPPCWRWDIDIIVHKELSMKNILAKASASKM